MDVMSVLTLQLAEIFGIYMLVVGAGGLVAPHRWQAMVEDMDRSPGLVVTLGFAVFVVGATLVIVHNHARDPLSFIVTLLGYAALAEGALLLAVPAPLLKFARRAVAFTRLWAIVSIVLGALLLFAGLTGRATVIV